MSSHNRYKTGIDLSGNIWHPRRPLSALWRSDVWQVKLSKKRKQSWRWFSSLWFQNAAKKKKYVMTFFFVCIIVCVCSELLTIRKKKKKSCCYQDIRNVRPGTSVHLNSSTIPLVARSPRIFQNGLFWPFPVVASFFASASEEMRVQDCEIRTLGCNFVNI